MFKSARYRLGLTSKKKQARNVEKLKVSVASENVEKNKSRKRKSEDGGAAVGGMTLRSAPQLIGDDPVESPSKRPKFGRMESLRKLKRRASEFFSTSIVPKTNGANRRQSLAGTTLGPAAAAAHTASSAAEPLLPPPLSGRFWGMSLVAMLDLEAKQLESRGTKPNVGLEDSESGLAAAAAAGMPSIFYLCLEWLHTHALDSADGDDQSDQRSSFSTSTTTGRTSHQCHGLFRISSDMKMQRQFRNYLEQRPDELEASISECSDQHLVANTLKSLLAELPGGLLTSKLLPKFAACDGVDQVRALVRELPSPNHNVLFDLCYFLWKFAELQHIHQMGVDNLATIFAPNFEGAPEQQSPLAQDESPRRASSTSSKSKSSSKRTGAPSGSGAGAINRSARRAGLSELDRMALLTKLTRVTQMMIEQFPVIFGITDEEEEEDDDDDDDEKVLSEENPKGNVSGGVAAGQTVELPPAVSAASATGVVDSGSSDAPATHSIGSTTVDPELIGLLKKATAAIHRSTNAGSSRKKKKQSQATVHLLVKGQSANDKALDRMLKKKGLKPNLQWQVDAGSPGTAVPVASFLATARAAHSIVVDRPDAIVQRTLISLSDAQLTRLLDDGSGTGVIRMPILVQNKKLFVGFSAPLWHAKLKH